MKTEQEKRGEYTRRRRKKFLYLKNTGQYSKIEPIKKEVGKTTQTKLETMQTMKKLLFVLPADNKYSRIIRRGVVIFLLAGISIVLQDILANQGQYIGTMWVPLITAVLAMIDKTLREIKGK